MCHKTHSIKEQNVMNAQYFNRHNNGDKITIWLLVDRQHDRQRLIWHYSCCSWSVVYYDVFTTESTMDKKTSSIKIQYAKGRLINVQTKHHIICTYIEVNVTGCRPWYII